MVVSLHAMVVVYIPDPAEVSTLAPAVGCMKGLVVVYSQVRVADCFAGLVAVYMMGMAAASTMDPRQFPTRAIYRRGQSSSRNFVNVNWIISPI